MEKEQERIAIKTEADFLSFCDHLKQSPRICVDTEFVRKSTFFPVASLIQLSTEHKAAVLDVLKPRFDLSPLFDILKDPKILKIFHAPSQDIELILSRFDTFVTPIFDTQMAASFLGYGDNISYGGLVEKRLGVVLAKESQVSDWLLRPLLAEQISYALSDVTYLWHVYDSLEKELIEKGRWEWVQEAIEVFQSKENFQPDVESAYKKVKGQLKGRKSLLILKMLASWREEEAIEKDMPRRRVMRDESILQIARLAPRLRSSADQRLLQSGTQREFIRYQSALWPLLKKGQAQIKEEKEKKNATGEEGEGVASDTSSFYRESLSSSLTALARLVIKVQSQKTGVSEMRLCPFSEAESFFFMTPLERETSFLMQGWRKEHIGIPLKEVLEGQKGIFLEPETQEITIHKF